MLILGIETSCDETASSVVKDGREVLSNVINSQIAIHEKFGGVVPEVASRKHIENISECIDLAIKQAGITFKDLDAVAVTAKPGLIGALLVGLSAARGLAFALDIPLIEVDHIEAHINANFIYDTHKDKNIEGTDLHAQNHEGADLHAQNHEGTDLHAQNHEGTDLQPPFVCLVASGGHSHIIHVKTYNQYECVGRTRDDAAGEAFDKVARILDLGYPGGPKVEACAADGEPNAVKLPTGKLIDTFDVSFSGLKTAVLNLDKDKYRKSDIAAAFQRNVTETLCQNLIKAAKLYKSDKIALAGGVAANTVLRKRARELATQNAMQLYYPSKILCTDNAAMVAARAYFTL